MYSLEQINQKLQIPNKQPHFFNFPTVLDRIIETKPKLVVEIGPWIGVSTSYMALISHELQTEIVAIDIWDGWWREMHVDPERAFAQNINEVQAKKRVRAIKGSSNDPKILEEFETFGVDVIFVDGCHESPIVDNDIRMWLPKLKVGGIMAGHDYHSQRFPDVTRAVDGQLGAENVEAIPNDYELDGVDGECWWYIKK